MTDQRRFAPMGLWTLTGCGKPWTDFEAQQEAFRPPLPTSPWKTGSRTPVSHKRPQAAAAGVLHNHEPDQVT